MKKISVKKGILLVIIVIAIIFAISTNVLATSSGVHGIVVPGLEGSNNSNSGQTENQVADNNDNEIGNQESSNTTVIPNTSVQGNGQNTTGSTYENTTLPQTGDASDYAIFMLIVVAGVVAVYTYKKVREYNI